MLKTFTRTFFDTILKLVDKETKFKRKNVDFVRTFKMKHCVAHFYIYKYCEFWDSNSSPPVSVAFFEVLSQPV